MTEILTFPRKLVADMPEYTPADQLAPLISKIQSQMTWTERQLAEDSPDLAQPIPCTIMLDQQALYRVLRRVDTGRTNLQGRISLIAGGHIDRSNHPDYFLYLLHTTLQRELEEELNAKTIEQLKLIALVIDHKDIDSSRHVAFIHQATLPGKITVKATEEFSKSSRLNNRPHTNQQLQKLRDNMDPWSITIYDHYIHPQATRK